MRSQDGFTLIEVLVALFIFAILSTIAAVGLRSVIHTYQHVKKEQIELQRLSIVRTLLQQDILQIVDRPAINRDGRQEPSLMSINDGFIFTRTGVINPFDNLPRSDMQRVAYTFENHQLIRSTWPSPDQTQNSEPEKHILLQGVTDMTVRFIDSQGLSSSQWPLALGSNQQVASQSTLPKAIEILLSIQDYGHLKFMLPLISGRQYETAP